MKNTITIADNKTLKLTNVLSIKLDITTNVDVNKKISQLESYIKIKGVNPIGPLCQKTSYTVDNKGNLNVNFFLMQQCDKCISNVEAPYKMDSIIRIQNCVYARFTGPESSLKLAYDKINVFAFEENIDLLNDNYTIYIAKESDYIVADVFVEKKSDE